MNCRGKYTDDDIRSMKKITARIAADYLGISPLAVTMGMRNSLLPITALWNSGKSYAEDGKAGVCPKDL